MPIRFGLLHEVVAMALSTLRANKLRSSLTVLGVVIGITSIVGMTSLIRGFDESLKDLFRELGPNTIIVSKFSGLSLGSGKDFFELLRRPNLTVYDAEAIERLAPSIVMVDVMAGGGGMDSQGTRIFYKSQRTKPVQIMGSSHNFAAVNVIPIEAGRFFTQDEVQRRRAVVVLGHTPKMALFENTDPIGKEVRIRGVRYTVVGVFGKRPSPGGFDMGQDDFAAIPYTRHHKQFGTNLFRSRGGGFSGVTIMAVADENVPVAQAIGEVESVMRIRHRLRLDEPNDFDIITQDAVLKAWDQMSSAVFLALIVISSIALLVGGIGVMAIMTISVTERTREIGIRKALGARRREILWQFLIEAGILTSVGGLIGIVFGSAIGLGVHYATGFPVNLPWWSFALGIGFSASVGIFFGFYPAFRAARLDPIEALRYE
jgi:putative ABC transport system permease protein